MYHLIETDSADFYSKNKRILLILLLPTPCPLLPFGFPNSFKWKMILFLLGILSNRRSHFAPSSMGRKWVVGADSSHTEISVIVWLHVTSSPQWQQLLINPTSHHSALPIGSFTPKLFSELFFFCVLRLCVFGWCSGWGGGVGGTGVCNCSHSTHHSVVCITVIVTERHCCHFSTHLKRETAR